jgi:ABC-type tungstate transport system permease subunit
VGTANGSWYREIGQGTGPGPALNMASSSNAYPVKRATTTSNRKS